MLKHLLKFALPLVISAIFLFSCSKSSQNDRTVNPPPNNPSDTTPVITKKWIVSTFAGSGMQGKDDGDSSNASFYAPGFITIDAQGNLYVSDLQNFNIRKITPGRHVSTYAGIDVGTTAQPFSNPFGLAIDKQGNLFDIESSFIRKISPSATSEVFAGSALVSYVDSTGVDASFNVISRLTINKQDNLYLTDYDMSQYPHVRKVTPDGKVTTIPLQDNTNYTDIALPDHYYLFAIVADSSGNLYKTSNGSCLIKKITPDGNVSVFAGAGNIGFTDGQGTAAQFFTISDMATDIAGNLYIADYGNGAIRKVSTDGKVTTIAGTGIQGFADGEGSKAQFNYPSGIVVDKNGIIYVADQANNRIRKIEYK